MLDEPEEGRERGVLIVITFQVRWWIGDEATRDESVQS